MRNLGKFGINKLLTKRLNLVIIRGPLIKEQLWHIHQLLVLFPLQEMLAKYSVL